MIISSIQLMELFVCEFVYQFSSKLGKLFFTFFYFCKAGDDFLVSSVNETSVTVNKQKKLLNSNSL